MEKELKKAVARYIDQEGVDKATSNAVNRLRSLVKSIMKGEDDDTGRIELCKFKFAIIEYLYFHDDTTKETVKLIESIIDERS